VAQKPGPSSGQPSSNRHSNRAGFRAKRASNTSRVPAEALSVWQEKDLWQFKLGEVVIDENRGNAALEAAARQRAETVEAAVVYAYLLDKERSTAWWREWAGYDLEQDLLQAAVLARPAVRSLLNSFNPKDNEWGVDNREDYADLLVHAHHTDIDEQDIRQGFRNWLTTLSPDARRLFASDLGRWMRG
jgi:hypothetical protein